MPGTIGTDTFHKVGQGESVESIAFRCGHFGDTIWDHPNNAQLKELRRDPDVLAPGDSLYIPALREQEEETPTGRKHTFRRRGVPSIIRFRPMAYGKPLAGASYSVIIDGGAPITGVSSDEGVIEEYAPPDARGAVITVEAGTLTFTYDLSLRTLAPADTDEGCRARLHNLGLYDGPLDGNESQGLKEVLQGFQSLHGLEATGTLDTTTVALLLQLHGR